MAKRKKNSSQSPTVNSELEGFDIHIDTFGEIKSNFEIDKLNQFLDKHVDDKKLRNREEPQ